jgi:hypothetical protein
MCELSRERQLAADSLRTNLKMIGESLFLVLREKNKRYGNSALEPAGVFYPGSASDSIRIRLDDKLKRVMNSKELRKNDLFDILGYMVLLCISENVLHVKDKVDDFAGQSEVIISAFVNEAGSHAEAVSKHGEVGTTRFFQRSGFYGLQLADNAIAAIKEATEENGAAHECHYAEVAAGIMLYFAENDVTDFAELLD